MRRVPRTAALVLRASTAFVQSKTDQMAAPSGAPPRSQTAVDCALACCVPGAVDVVLSPTMARRAMHLKFHDSYGSAGCRPLWSLPVPLGSRYKCNVNGTRDQTSQKYHKEGFASFLPRNIPSEREHQTSEFALRASPRGSAAPGKTAGGRLYGEPQHEAITHQALRPAMSCRSLPGGCGGATALSLRNVSRAAAAHARLNVTLPAVSKQDGDWAGQCGRTFGFHPSRWGRCPNTIRDDHRDMAESLLHALHTLNGTLTLAGDSVLRGLFMLMACVLLPHATSPQKMTNPHFTRGRVQTSTGATVVFTSLNDHVCPPVQERHAAARRRRGQRPQAPWLSVGSPDCPCCPCSRPCGAGTVDGGGKARGPRFQAGAAALWLARPQRLAGRGRLGKLRGAPRA